MGYFVPETMKNIDNWVCWDENKVPHDPKTGQKAKVNAPETWGSYENAVNCAKYGGFSGIGFVFTEQIGLVFIDLDGCIDDDGEETQLAKDVQALFPGSYSEISQSGSGLHIVCKGYLPKAVKQKEIEMYSKGRYMAFTGNAVSPTEPQEAQEGIYTLYNFATPTEPAKPPKRQYGTRTAQTPEEILDKILQSTKGEQFARLFSVESAGYDDLSKADLVFISIANHFCNGDEELIRALWFMSERCNRIKNGQRKGQRNDYVNMTIAKAKATYTGSTDRRRATDHTPPSRKRRFL